MSLLSPLRVLQFYRGRPAHFVVNLLQIQTLQTTSATSAFHSLTGTTRWPFKVFARDLKDASCCFLCWNSVHRYFHATLGYGSVDKNFNKNSLSEDLPSIENVQQGHNTAVESDTLLVKDRPAVIKGVLKLDVDFEKPDTHIHLDETKREVTVYVNDAFVKTKAMDLYKVIRKMDAEQVDLFINLPVFTTDYSICCSKNTITE